MHLAAHLGKTNKRNKDFSRIMTKLKSRPPKELILSRRNGGGETKAGGGGGGGGGGGKSGGSGGKAGLYDEYDYIFAFGDLNYRIEQVPYAEVVDMTEGAMKESAMKGTDMPSAKTNCIKFLLENDQLHATMRRGVPDLTEFGEAPINFFPTYKFDRKNPMIYDRTTYIRLWQRHDGVMQN
jgi:hypothetical protein